MPDLPDGGDSLEPGGSGNGRRNGRYIVSPVVVNVIAIVVTTVWAVSFIADIALDNYAPPIELHLVMLTIVAALFGIQVARKS